MHRNTDDAALRFAIYRAFADTGNAPTRRDLATLAGGTSATSASLARLHDAHAIVLDDRGDIRMALPFSAVETGHRVVSKEQSWSANCAWDTLAIPVALAIDAEIEATWLDTAQPVELGVVGGEPTHMDGFIHLAVPARRWWDDVVET